MINKVRSRIQEKGLSIWQAFSAFDENRDGIISSAEFLKTFRIMGLGMSDTEIERLFKYFDPRNSGRIDYKVFCDKVMQTYDTQKTGSWEEVMIDKVRNRIQEKKLSIRDAFLAFDENKDGNISSAEFLKTFKIMELGMTDNEINRLMNYFDPQRTGNIDYQSFCERVAQKKTPKTDEPWEEVMLNKVRNRLIEKNLSIREAFLAFDENRDGSISSAEFFKAFKIMDLGMTDNEINRLMNYFDPRKTESIDYKIFCDRVAQSKTTNKDEGWEENMIKQVRNRIQEKKLSAREAFAAFDENRDGTISSAEFTKAFKIMELGLSDPDIERLMRVFDPRKSGKINYRVFCDKIMSPIN